VLRHDKTYVTEDADHDEINLPAEPFFGKLGWHFYPHHAYVTSNSHFV